MTRAERLLLALREVCAGVDVGASRERGGWTQERLGELLGVDERTVRRWESAPGGAPESVRLLLWLVLVADEGRS